MDHLRVLRELLERDYLVRADREFALEDIARMARDAVEADEAFVALWSDSRGWRAVSSEGEQLGDADISSRGSRTVLERARAGGGAVIATAEHPLELSSESLRAHQVESVLAVPLRAFGRTAERGGSLLGCLYAHRTLEQEPFGDQEVAIVTDIARIVEPLLNVLEELAAVRSDLDASRREVDGLRKEAALPRLADYRTRSAAFERDVLEVLRAAARADRVGLLLLGPTGSGKSQLARAYHDACPRRGGPFVVLDASQATSAETLAAELFGYAPRSGFANAPPAGRAGAAELAHGGTLFLDEVGTLPRELQQRLLALLQDGTFSPLGSGERRTVDLQVIAATNEDLPARVRAREFREDLYFRLALVTVRLPALSERPEDVPELSRSLFAKARRTLDRRDVRELDPAAADALARLDWSAAGNIRGLEHTIARSLILAPSGTTRLEERHLRLPEELRTAVAPATTSAGPEIEAIKRAIQEHGYATAAAKALGISHGTLVWRLRKAGLTVRDVLAR